MLTFLNVWNYGCKVQLKTVINKSPLLFICLLNVVISLTGNCIWLYIKIIIICVRFLHMLSQLKNIALLFMSV